MGNNQSIDVSALKNDITRYARNVCRYAASEIADELTEETMLSIASFYTDYSPSKYKRHYYNFMNHSYRRYYSNPHNKIFRGGVELTPQLMDSLYYKASPEEVFGAVMELGSHGPELYTSVPPMENPPLRQIYQKRDEMYDHIDKYVDRARVKAQKDSYTILRFK